MEKLEKAILLNQQEQKKIKKENYTKPELFVKIENFIKNKKLIGYGGTAINKALPIEFQFYQETDIPDYDFFSTSAKEDLIELSNMLYKDFKTIEVKTSMFKGTYKLFVNYLPLVDMTQLDEQLFKNLFNESFIREGIHYVPYNYLRMSMHQELSRPMGDLSRWTKVYQRLELLNKHHPFLVRKCDINPIVDVPQTLLNDIVNRLQDYVFFGDYCIRFWEDLFPKKYQKTKQDVLFILSETIGEIWEKLNGLTIQYTFYQNKLVNVYEVYIENYPMLYVVLSDSCMNYNIYQKMKVATYDTFLSLCYGLSFINMKHIKKQRLLSLCYLLNQIKEDTHPLMNRYTLPCYGKQLTIEDIRRRRDKDKKKFRYKPSLKKIKKKLTTRKRIQPR